MIGVFSFSDLWTFPHENMANGVSEALKIVPLHLSVRTQNGKPRYAPA